MKLSIIHHTSFVKMKKYFYLFFICGFLASICYIIPTQVRLNFKLNFYMFTHFGFFVTLSAIGLYFFLRETIKHFTFKVGVILLLISGLINSIYATMQGANLAWLRKSISKSSDKNSIENFKTIFRGVFSSQFGIDYAFDIFISTGLFFLAFSLLSNPKFGKIIPILGMLISLTGYIFNSISFPEGPENMGLIDPGPFFSVWFGIFLVQISVFYYKGKFNILENES